ncbi:hypothetical protein FANTH_9406 [Fusarium anthophilum]|uniref:BRCT domain-containing protein n=1 Tax=Fusarium anthophilum TaxID=48485 RepID=A0A8H4Z6R6_9HYPO|nr:hypothetical protein FANTH_9406 [Fusarium anthophilum]
MAPGTKGAVDPLADFVITVHGPFGKVGGKKYTHNYFKDIIREFGGRFVSTVTKDITHVVTTYDSLHADTAVMKANEKLDSKLYAWKDWGEIRTKSAKPKLAKQITKSKSAAKSKNPAKPKSKPAAESAAKPEKSAKPESTAKPKPVAVPRTPANPIPLKGSDVCADPNYSPTSNRFKRRLRSRPS